LGLSEDQIRIRSPHEGLRMLVVVLQIFQDGLLQADLPGIQAEELKQRLDAGDNLLFLLDVREEYEYEISNIGGHLIPLAEFRAGFAKVRNLAGGIGP
jgi:adenylyltransferase/sulfurtransferase